MGIQFDCQCGKPYRVSNKYAGQPARCRHCGAALSIPAAQPAAPALAGPPEPATGVPEETPDLAALHHHPASLHPPSGRVERQRGEGFSAAENDSNNPQLQRALPARSSRPSQREGKTRPNQTSPKEPAPSLLQPAGDKPALPSRSLFSAVKKQPGTQLISSHCYRLAGQPRFQVYAGFGHQLANTNPGEHDLARLEVFHLRDGRGEYAVIQPYDGTGPLPTEYMARMPGCLPTPLALLKTSGDRQLELGHAIAGPLGVLLAQAASKVQSVWAAIDGSQPPLAAAAQQNATLSTTTLWDGEFKMGPLSVTHHLRWGAQAIPLDQENYLLVAAAVPRKKLLGLRFDLPWFADYRSQFAQLVAAQPAPTACGQFGYVDPGVWLLAAREALGWVAADAAS